ncbi:helix-hairpin-helix domain-containing protein [Erysipelotrichaceae bacterium OttesenSCG-928-M19]|nr:helix-hairpin-helix domain-containing protein [Erysipelotrichaceae bacterium OttesenSCG-928-M19]
MSRLLFFLIVLFSYGCHDNLTLNQIEYNKEVRIKVTITGHINKPGTYVLEKDAQVKDLIVIAKGYKANAEYLNDEEKLNNNQILFINSNVIKNKINLNDCSSIELQKIKGIGPKLAYKIIEYRQKYGNYQILTDLMKVKGIKQKLFNKIYEYLKT